MADGQRGLEKPRLDTCEPHSLGTWARDRGLHGLQWTLGLVAAVTPGSSRGQ